MNIIPIHEYLEMNIDEILEVEFEVKQDFADEKRNHWVKKINDFLYGSVYRDIHFYTRTDNTINKISISINGELSKELFEKMCDVYGYPKNIYEMDKLLDSKSSSGLHDGFGITSHAYSYTLKNCAFQDNPCLILWDKGSYAVECTIKRLNAYEGKSETSETIIRIKAKK